MYAGRGVARLLLVAAFAVAVAGHVRRPRSKPTRFYRPNKDAAQLLEHVMMHEEQWTDVLQQHILGLGDPPYKERMFDAPPLEPLQNVNTIKFGENPIYDVRKIVFTITRYYGAIRSFVEYGAKAVRSALACYTFKQVELQWRYTKLTILNKEDTDLISKAINSFKKNTSKYIEFLSAVPNHDLTLLLEAYWKGVKLLQFGWVQRVDRQDRPEYMKQLTDIFDKKIANQLKLNCLPYLSNDDIYELTGVPRNIPLILDKPIDSVISSKDFEEIINKQTEHWTQNAKGLSLVTMTDHSWTSLFIYRDQPRMDITEVVEAIPSTSEAKPESELEYPPPPTEDA